MKNTMITADMFDNYPHKNTDTELYLEKMPIAFKDYINEVSDDGLNYLLDTYKEFNVISIDDIFNLNIVFVMAERSTLNDDVYYMYDVDYDNFNDAIEKLISSKIPFNVHGDFADESGFNNIMVRYNEDGTPLVKHYTDETDDHGKVNYNDLFITNGYIRHKLGDINSFEREQLKIYNLMGNI